MEKKTKNRRETIEEGISKGEYPPKSFKTDKFVEDLPKKIEKSKFFAIFFGILSLAIMLTFWGYVTYGGSFFDENVTHRSCDFLSIEGLPTLVRCSDGTYWDASKHQSGQSGSVEIIVPVSMVIEPTQPPFLYQKVDTSKL